MERYEYLQNVKKKQKELAKNIRKLKLERKQDNRNGRSLWSIESELYENKYEYRHRHVAYCTVRGRERHEIEQPHSGNEPNERYINELLAEYEQTVCVSSD